MADKSDVADRGSAPSPSVSGGDQKRSAHTPGPWKRSSFDSAEIIGPRGEDIASVAAHDSMSDLTETQDADARLISAAPDLLEALKRVTDMLHDISKDEVDDPSVGITGWTDCRRAVAEARAALSKASA